MTERERLTALLHDATLGASKHPLADYLKKGTEEAIADYLLANGVVVPPVALGQIVYSLEKGVSRVFNGEVYEMVARKEAVVSRATRIGYYSTVFTAENIGKNVFLSREEAEKALEGSRG